MDAEGIPAWPEVGIDGCPETQAFPPLPPVYSHFGLTWNMRRLCGWIIPLTLCHLSAMHAVTNKYGTLSFNVMRAEATYDFKDYSNPDGSCDRCNK